MEVGGRNNSYPGGKLSNFTGFQFVFDDVECCSMEGLLQAFKYEKIDSQIATCQLVGFTAKKKGSGRNSYISLSLEDTITFLEKAIYLEYNSRDIELFKSNFIFNKLYKGLNK